MSWLYGAVCPPQVTGLIRVTRTRRNRYSLLSIASCALALSAVLGCGHSDLAAVDYKPQRIDGWRISTPAAQGLDPELVAELYTGAAKLETLYSLLVVKNGHLIAEGYFNAGAIDQLSGRQSVTKSVTSALVGIALEQGCLESLDQRLVDFFPELEKQITDPRKKQITLRQMLKMRAGYPNEESTPPYLELLFFRDNWRFIPHLVNFPLTGDPGEKFQYSNLSSHLLGVAVARACKTDLESYAQKRLFIPIGAAVEKWSRDADGYNFGALEIYLTARDMARFGQLYLGGGNYEGRQVLSTEWVENSLRSYSSGIRIGGWLTSRYGDFRNLGYGYQWWSARVGGHSFNYAAGHGANYIILLHDLDMIIVSTADPLYGPELAAGGGWKFEGAINKTVARFIKSLPTAD